MSTRSVTILSLIVIAVTFTGCGGGSNDPSPSSSTSLIQNPEELQSLAENEPPSNRDSSPEELQSPADNEPPSNRDSSDIAGELERIKKQAVDRPSTGTFILTVFKEPAGHVEEPLDRVRCRSTTCITPDGRVKLSDFEFNAAKFEVIMTRNGIPIMYFENGDVGGIGPTYWGTSSTSESPRSQAEIPDTIGYGGWLKYSAFATLAGPFHTQPREDGFAVATLPAFYSGALEGGEYIPRTGAFSFGVRTENPMDISLASVTWEGVMAGIDTVFDHPIQGDARLTVNLSRLNPTVDVMFSRIFDLETRTHLTRPDLLPETSPSEVLIVEFLNLHLTGANGFGSTQKSWSLEGWFYGPNHEEAGGVFQHLDYEMVGAFGVKR